MQEMTAPPTILRIKRKRTDEPVDALVIEARSRRKKSRGASGFFQFAETVEEDDFWQDPALKKDLRERIATLANAIPLVAEVVAAGGVEKPERRVPSGRRYTVVGKQSDAKPPLSQESPPDGTQHEDLNVYDAILEEGAPTGTMPVQPPDPGMEKFLPMLEEYLRMNDVPSKISKNSPTPGDEYVWDIFYHRHSNADWTEATNVATLSGLPPLGSYDSDSGSESAGDPDDEDSNTEDFYRNDYPDEDPDQESGEESDSEEYPVISDDEDGEDERELNEFFAWRRRR